MSKNFTHVIEAIFYSLIALSLIVLMSCGGGGSDSTPAPAPAPTINVNASGYPDVAGVYSIRVPAMPMTCTDGSTSTVDAITQNVSILQNINQILIVSTSTSQLPANLTVLSNSGDIGSVDLSSNFIANQIVVATITNTPGNWTFTYNMTGAFTTAGWSGTYRYTGYSDYYKASCTGTQPFAGELISKSAAIKSPSEQAEADGTPLKVESVYDLATRLLGLSVDGSGPSDNP